MNSKSDRLGDLLLNDRGFVFDPNTGDSYQLSATGLFCLRGLQQGMTVCSLVAGIVSDYEVAPLAARCDLDAFFWDLKQLGWI